MGIEMPAEVRWLIPIVVGDSWPEGDETALQRLAEVWKQAATDVDDAMREAEDAVKQATSNMDGEAAEAFKKYWEKFVKGEEATLPKMKDVSDKLSTACRNCAMQIEYAKLSIIIALVILAIQIAVMIASAVASFGASTAGIVPAQMATRAGVQIVFRQLVQKLMQQVGRNLIGKLALQVGIEVATSVATDLAVQGIQLAKGTRDTLDTKMTLDAAKSGLISGVVGMGVGAGMGKALGDGVGDSIGRSLGRNAAEEAITGAGSALAEGALSEEGFKAENVLFGATSGAVSGSVSGTKSGIEGMNADLGVPTAGDMPRPDAAPRMDAPPAPPSTAPVSTPDAEAPPRRSADATNTSYAAPPTEQPQHRAVPDPSPAPPPSPQSQGFGQSPGQSAPATAPASSNAPSSAPPAARTSMPSASPVGGPSPSSGGGFSPSSAPAATGGHSPSAGPSPTGAAGTAHAGGPAPSHSPSPTGNGHSPSPAGGGHSSNAAGPTAGHSPSAPGTGPVPGGGHAPGAGNPVPPSGGHAPSPLPGGPSPAGHAPAAAGPAPQGPVHSGPPAGQSLGGPNHAPPLPGAPGPHSPSPHPTSGPGMPAGLSGPGQHRSPAGDAIHQAATSAPLAPPPFTAPPNRHNEPTPLGHGPAQQGFPATHQPATHQPPAPHHQGSRPQQAGPPAQRPQHPQPTHQPVPRHAQPPQPGPQRHPAPQQTAAAHVPPSDQRSAPQHQPTPAATSQPHERQARSPLEELARQKKPISLPEHLKHLQNHTAHTKAGLSLHDNAGAGWNRRDSSVYSATTVAPDQHRYTVDVHGSADNVRIGDTELTPKDVADIIRSSGDWDGRQPIRLLSCQTGTKADGFAAKLSQELGVEVMAPTKDAWVDDMGNVFASSTHYDHKRGGDSPGWPPNGDWATFRPDGTSSKHDRSTAPGTRPTWGDDVPEQGLRAHRRGEPMVWVQDRFGNAMLVPASHVAPPHQVRQPPPPPPPQPNRGQRPPMPPPPNQGRRPAGPPPGQMPPRFPQQSPVPPRLPQPGPGPGRFPQPGPGRQRFSPPPPNHQRPPLPPPQHSGRPLPPNPGQQRPNWQPPAPGNDWRPARPADVSEVQWHRPGDDSPVPSTRSDVTPPQAQQAPEQADRTEDAPARTPDPVETPGSVADTEPVRDTQPAPEPEPVRDAEPTPAPEPEPKPELPPSRYSAQEDGSGIMSRLEGCEPPPDVRREWAQKAHDLREDAIAKGATDYADPHSDDARAHGAQAAPDGVALHFEDISDKAAWRISSEELYRFDNRHPTTVFGEGFHVSEHKQGGTTREQVTSNSGRMVSVTRDSGWYTSKQFGGSQAPQVGDVAYNYVIDAPGGLDVLATLEREGHRDLLLSVDQEAEVGFLGGVDRRFVKEAIEVKWDGTQWVPTRQTFTNPHYEPHTTDALGTTS